MKDGEVVFLGKIEDRFLHIANAPIIPAENPVLLDERVPRYEVLIDRLIVLGGIDVNEVDGDVQMTEFFRCLAAPHPDRDNFMSELFMDDVG